MSARTYLGFLPWIVFAVVGRGSLEGVAWGGVAALAHRRRDRGRVGPRPAR